MFSKTENNIHSTAHHNISPVELPPIIPESLKTSKHKGAENLENIFE
jgi:hypothetical protein